MSEAIEHEILCNYIKVNYPDVVFLSDSSGISFTSNGKKNWAKINQIKRTRSSNGIPDLIILYPSSGYHGLMIELKRTGEKIYKKDGSLKTDHLKEQNEVLHILESLGYVARFAIGFEEARKLVDEYMNNNL